MKWKMHPWIILKSNKSYFRNTTVILGILECPLQSVCIFAAPPPFPPLPHIFKHNNAKTVNLHKLQILRPLKY